MQVFISHAPADQPLACDLASEMEKAGIQAWNPEKSIFPGDNWALEVGKALENSDVMVVLFTRRSKESPWIRKDVQFALTSGNYQGRVIAVLIDWVTFRAGADVPWVLLAMEPIYLDGSSPDWSQVVKRVQQAVEASHASG